MLTVGFEYIGKTECRGLYGKKFRKIFETKCGNAGCFLLEIRLPTTKTGDMEY